MRSGNGESPRRRQAESGPSVDAGSLRGKERPFRLRSNHTVLLLLGDINPKHGENRLCHPSSSSMSAEKWEGLSGSSGISRWHLIENLKLEHTSIKPFGPNYNTRHAYNRRRCSE